MTDNQKDQIAAMRKSGSGYKKLHRHLTCLKAQ